MPGPLELVFTISKMGMLKRTTEVVEHREPRTLLNVGKDGLEVGAVQRNRQVQSETREFDRGDYGIERQAHAPHYQQPDYNPLWDEVFVVWKPSATPVLLLSDNQINALAKAGKLTLKDPHIVLNAPITKVGK